ncbi:nucleotidyltransferase family protein [Methylocaldum sp.]|uniref:nucleotidyltransferase domain-containing protein n=1 Tax=Methylocaldum sp. TaxID=1969727 RepID=UPI002D4B8E0C|nr:nucleotidyltransferase family protein [Methylocaldum sp.]HYE37640.1 nucleotidyltransferase family protein [Methylocaldum sp.]
MLVDVKKSAVDALTHREALTACSLAEWDVIIRQCRAAKVLAKLAVQLEDCGLLDCIPEAPRRHLTAARLVANRQDQAVGAEVEQIRKALLKTRVPIVLLKGAAYAMADLPAARGRVFGDIDILVPKERLPDVEAALMLHGWVTTHHNAYDQRYYRQWMHEIPPMRHMRRGTVIDVHHAITPATSRIRADSEKMLATAVPLPGYDNLLVLAPEDMVLHSATHLFLEGELDSGLRDLADIDSLLIHFSAADDDFWNRLVRRATEVGLARPLFYALRYAEKILGTRIPPWVQDKVVMESPSRPLLGLTDALFLRALQPKHATAADHFTGLARWMLYVRGHWLRMPLPLLIYHLARKAFAVEQSEQNQNSKRAH